MSAQKPKVKKQRNPNVRSKSNRNNFAKKSKNNRSEAMRNKLKERVELNNMKREERNAALAAKKNKPLTTSTVNDKNGNLSRIEKTKKSIKDSDNRNTMTKAQLAVQSEEMQLTVYGSDAEQNKLAEIVEERDREAQPKLTGLLKTNTQILDVLTRMYQKSHDDQDTGFDTGIIPSTNNNNNKKPSTDSDKKDKPTEEETSNSILGVLGGVLGGLISGAIFKKMLKFSPLGWMMKKLKSLSKLLSAKVIDGLKYLGQLGLKSLKSMVSTLRNVVPQVGKMLKVLGEMGFMKGGKVIDVIKATSKAGVKLVTKGGARVAAKLASKVALKAGANVAARAATASIPIAGWVVTAGLTAMDAAEGWKTAANSLGVSDEDLTIKNKTASALASVLTLGFGNDNLAKGINRSIGGEESTLSKHYENMGIIDSNMLSNDTIDFEAYKKLSLSEQQSIFNLDAFSNEDMEKMQDIITKNINYDNSQNTTNTSSMFMTPAKLNEIKISKKYKKLLSERKSRKKVNGSFGNAYLNKPGTWNYSTMSMNTGDSIDVVNTNTGDSIDVDDTSTEIIINKSDNNNEVEVNETTTNENTTISTDVNNLNTSSINNTNINNSNTTNIIDAESNKADRENIINTASTDLVNSEINKTNNLTASLQQVQVQRPVMQQSTVADTSGSDRVLNLFAQLT